MTDNLKARIEGAIGHGLWFAQSDPDSVHPEATKAVLAVVQPILADRDRLAEELEENVRVMNVLRRQRDEAKAAVGRARRLANEIEKNAETMTWAERNGMRHIVERLRKALEAPRQLVDQRTMPNNPPASNDTANNPKGEA